MHGEKKVRGLATCGGPGNDNRLEYEISPSTNMVDVGSVDLTKEMKRGKACEKYILLFIPIGGRASVVDAARSGDISEIKAIDYESNNYLVYGEDCVIVHGD